MPDSVLFPLFVRQRDCSSEYLAGFIQLDPDTVQDSQGLATGHTLEFFSLASFFSISQCRIASFKNRMIPVFIASPVHYIEKDVFIQEFVFKFKKRGRIKIRRTRLLDSETKTNIWLAITFEPERCPSILPWCRLIFQFLDHLFKIGYFSIRG